MSLPERIVVTDSGLGGLTIAARLEARCPNGLELTYVNCRPTVEGGFNLLPGRTEQVACFTRVLVAIRERFAPDALIIACNTLSVLFPETSFATQPFCQIYEILAVGAAAIHQRWAQQPEADILILGTRVTTASNEHRRRLVQLGVPGHAIHALPCHGLATLIESAQDPALCHQAVADFAREAAQRLPSSHAPLLLALCCTHYGCIADDLRQTFSTILQRPVDILDPNAALADAISCSTGSQPNRVQVVSRVPTPAAGIDRFTTLVEAVSPRLAAALQTNLVIPDLF